MSFPKYVQVIEYTATSKKKDSYSVGHYLTDKEAMVCSATEGTRKGLEDKDIYRVILFKRVGESHRNCYMPLVRLFPAFNGVEVSFQKWEYSWVLPIDENIK